MRSARYVTLALAAVLFASGILPIPGLQSIGRIIIRAPLVLWQALTLSHPASEAVASAMDEPPPGQAEAPGTPVAGVPVAPSSETAVPMAPLTTRRVRLRRSVSGVQAPASAPVPATARALPAPRPTGARRMPAAAITPEPSVTRARAITAAETEAAPGVELLRRELEEAQAEVERLEAEMARLLAELERAQTDATARAQAEAERIQAEADRVQAELEKAKDEVNAVQGELENLLNSILP